jgi:putative SOS response-associated peptidase YedK
MSIRYLAAHEHPHYLRQFGIEPLPAPREVRVGEQGVFVRRPRADRLVGGVVPSLEAATGRWGLIPLFSLDGLDRSTHEAASETAATERNFLQPWKRGHRCVVVVNASFELLSAGAMVRIARADGKPFCIAGLWNGWRSPEGACVESFAMLTIDASRNRLPQLKRNDSPQRMPVVLPDAWVDEWFNAPVEETAAFLRPYPLHELVAEQFSGSPTTA